jgi:hypothetical protein
MKKILKLDKDPQPASLYSLVFRCQKEQKITISFLRRGKKETTETKKD